MHSQNHPIRHMEVVDLNSVVKIEEETFPMPFSGSLFHKFMDQEAFHCWVIESNKEVIGYIIYSVAADEVDILNIAIEKERRRRGFGSQLIKHMMQHAASLGGEHIFLEVRSSNLLAQSFYQKWGFIQVGIKPGYYHDSGEDALVFSREVREHD